MARAIVTDEAVVAAAEQLVADGEEPSIIRVQELVGGGSYSTVKRYLDAWKAQRQVPATSVQAPREIMERAAEFGRLLWQAAAALAAQEVAQVREEVRRQVVQAREAEAEGERAITLLESQIEQQVLQLEAFQRDRDDARDQLGQSTIAAQVTAVRLEEQGRYLADLRHQVEVQAQELAQARAELLAQARHMGELEALRRQLAERSS